MNNSTKNLTFYILIFFSIFFVSVIAFFSYNIFFIQENPIENIETDDSFNNIFEEKEEENTEKKKEYANYENKKCAFGEDFIDHGKEEIFYEKDFVGVYQDCGDFAKKRTCFDGIWAGEEKYKYQSCQRTLNCKTENGTIVNHNESIEMFSKKEVPFGESCETYKKERTCRETFLYGGKDFKYEKCEVSNQGVCEILDKNGEKIKMPNGSSRLFFSKNEVEYNENCSDFSQRRFCGDGVLANDEKFAFSYCEKKNAANCFLDGVELLHGQERFFYSKTRSTGGKTCAFFAEPIKCNNGILEGKEEYNKKSCVE